MKNIVGTNPKQQKMPNKPEKHNIYDDQTKITNLYTHYERTTAKREENYMKNHRKVKISTFIVKKITESQKN